MFDKKLLELKREVFYANKKLVEEGLVIFTFGNVSGIDRQRGIVAIKPSGMDYDKISWQDMVLVNLEGQIINSRLKPSSDTKTHLKLYREFPLIGGVAHTHSRYATAFAQAKLSVKCLGTTHADYFYGEIPCTDFISNEAIEKAYEEETGELIINTFKFGGKDYLKINAVLIAGHGPFTWGDNAEQAVLASIVLEEIAERSFYTQLLNPKIRSINNKLLDKHYLRKHGKDAYYGQP